MNDISGKIINFHNRIKSDKNHRFKSWEHCYSYFRQENIDPDYACLHLAFYLASWGMYRGSSFLIWKDYLIHKEVVFHILKNKHLQDIDFIEATDMDLKDIFGLISWIKNWYQDNVVFIKGESKKINVTDTLATKIILGTLGCLPAYDRYFIDGIRKKGLSYSGIKPNNFKPIIEFYKSNLSDFMMAEKYILEDSGIKYPPMKLLDMYFWELGYDLQKP